MGACKWFHASTLLLFLCNGSELLGKTDFIRPEPIEVDSGESEEKYKAKNAFFSSRPLGWLIICRRSVWISENIRLLEQKKQKKNIQTLTKKDACVHINNAANFTVRRQTLIRNKCVSDWCNKTGGGGFHYTEYMRNYRTNQKHHKQIRTELKLPALNDLAMIYFKQLSNWVWDTWDAI